MHSLMTVSILGLEDGRATETPAIVVNWDEAEDGDLETLVDSRLFLMAIGMTDEIDRMNEARKSNEMAEELWRAAQSVFTWRHASPDERAAWDEAVDRFEQENGDRPPIFLHDLRPAAH